jgi:hypothetical protein
MEANPDPADQGEALVGRLPTILPALRHQEPSHALDGGTMACAAKGRHAVGLIFGYVKSVGLSRKDHRDARQQADGKRLPIVNKKINSKDDEWREKHEPPYGGRNKNIEK